MSAQLVAHLERRGFDRSIDDEDDGGVFAACSQCQAMVINGTACHERGCPNETRECSECENRVPKRTFKYLCEECANPYADDTREEFDVWDCCGANPCECD